MDNGIFLHVGANILSGNGRLARELRERDAAKRTVSGVSEGYLRGTSLNRYMEHIMREPLSRRGIKCTRGCANGF